MDSATAPVTLFYSYAHEDEALRDELQGHLKLLERRSLLAPWHDRRIVPGADGSGEIDAYLRSAELVLLLVSKDFIESDYIMGTELAAVMKRVADRSAVVVPIVVRAVDFDPEDDANDLPFLKLQGLPTDLRPVDRIVADVSRQIVESLQARGAAPMDRGASAQLHAQTREPIELPEQQRVLWVDDRPEGNRFETAALAKLQIEVVTARHTDEAMALVADDTEGFSLVISDWERRGEAPEAGLRLLARLRAAGQHWPLVCCHGEAGAARAERAAQARAAGAFGEAVLPHALMPLVLQAMQAEGPSARAGAG